MWEGIDEPLPDGNWDVVAASPVSYNPTVNQVPHELTVDELDEIRDQFVDCARRGAEAGFDVLELHCAHGYLLSGFLSPVTNRRTDAYGGDIEGRLRWPLEVFGAMRAVWPADRPMTVRISATDWVDDGQTLDDTVRVAQAFADAGAAAIDVSTGQVTSAERPAFGRSYQTPYADAIRNRTDVPTIAVGVISSYDDVNSILMAGRADLCALGRVHLYDPSWTLHAALDQDYDGPAVTWPLPWQAGKRKPQTGRSDGPKPRLQLIREGATGTRHRRWRPGSSGAPRPSWCRGARSRDPTGEGATLCGVSRPGCSGAGRIRSSRRPRPRATVVPPAARAARVRSPDRRPAARRHGAWRSGSTVVRVPVLCRGARRRGDSARAGPAVRTSCASSAVTRALSLAFKASGWVRIIGTSDEVEQTITLLAQPMISSSPSTQTTGRTRQGSSSGTSSSRPPTPA